MQKEFDIKWKSHDISGSASLALWANMNQSTTQLGSKRQSQVKHPYLTINIFICCCVVIICPVSIYFYVIFFFFPFLWLLRRLIICFTDLFLYVFFVSVVWLFIFTKMVLLLAAILPCQWVCLKSLWCSSLLYVLFPWRHTLYHSVDIHLHGTFFNHLLVEAVIS